MADLEDDDAELGGELIELTTPNVEEAVKLVLDHWVKIFLITKIRFIGLTQRLTLKPDLGVAY